MELDINADRPEYEKLQEVISGISDKRKTFMDSIRKNISSLKADKTTCERQLKEARQEMLTAQIAGNTENQKKAEAVIESLSAQIKEDTQRIENYSSINVFDMLLPEFDAVRDAVVSCKASDEAQRQKILEHIEQLKKLDQEIQNKIRYYYGVRDMSTYETGMRELSGLIASLLGVSPDTTVVKQICIPFGFYSQGLDYEKPLPEQLKEIISKYGTAGNDY